MKIPVREVPNRQIAGKCNNALPWKEIFSELVSLFLRLIPQPIFFASIKQGVGWLTRPLDWSRLALFMFLCILEYLMFFNKYICLVFLWHFYSVYSVYNIFSTLLCITLHIYHRSKYMGTLCLNLLVQSIEWTLTNTYYFPAIHAFLKQNWMDFIFTRTVQTEFLVNSFFIKVSLIICLPIILLFLSHLNYLQDWLCLLAWFYIGFPHFHKAAT